MPCSFAAAPEGGSEVGGALVGLVIWPFSGPSRRIRSMLASCRNCFDSTITPLQARSTRSNQPNMTPFTGRIRRSIMLISSSSSDLTGYEGGAGDECTSALSFDGLACWDGSAHTSGLAPSLAQIVALSIQNNAPGPLSVSAAGPDKFMYGSCIINQSAHQPSDHHQQQRGNKRPLPSHQSPSCQTNIHQVRPVVDGA